MAKTKKMLIIATDVDNDVGEKTGLRGPIIGREANIKAATKLALKDPAETDSNTIFQAVKEYDQLSQDYKTEVATITGNSRLGFYADREITSQLEKVLTKFQADECVFVSDSAHDDQVIPIIQSRVKITSVRHVIVRQTKELEKTYFVILEKLKEPHYARIVFGIPAIALLLYFWLADAGIRVFIGLLGAYLLIKGFGIEEVILRKISSIQVSIDNPSFVFYFLSIPIAIVALFVAADNTLSSGLGGVKLAAQFTKTFLLLFTASLLLIVAGNTVQHLSRKKRYLIADEINHASSIVLLSLVFYSASEWILGNDSFQNIFYLMLLSTAALFIVIRLSRELKNNLIANLNLEGKEVYSELGGSIGTIKKVSPEKNFFEVKTINSQKIDFDFDQISKISEKIIVRY
ncbi:MAG: DUF373 family protein [Candidatus Micrarchaeia archaeon]